MKARILKVVKPNVKVLKEVVNVLKNGGLIIYPTETCYGIGTDATNSRSIEKIYEIKGRDPSKPIPILVSSLNMIKKYGEITKKTEFLVKKFMPGPLSIIIKKKRPISDANKNSVSFRISSHPVASLLVKLLKRPITTTSANLSGEPSIYEISKIIENFKDKVDVILDCGDLSRVESSTCINMGSDDVKIIREGPIPSGLILKELKKRS
jgi:L-threonylcarbamoyladenylate synthase